LEEKIVLIVEDESKHLPAVRSIPVAGPVHVMKTERKAQYDLFFTDRRIIAAVVFSTSDLSKVYVSGPLRGFEVMMKYKKLREKRRQEFKNKTPDEILHMHPENFEIPYDRIRSIKVNKGLFGANIEIEAIHEGSIKKIKLPIPKKRFDDVKLVVNQYLGDKVK